MNEEVRVLTLWQPWATLCVLGWKNFETRSWSTPFRGTLLIHAAKRLAKREELADIACKSDGQFSGILDMDFSYGAIVGAVKLVNVYKMSQNVVFDKFNIDISTVSISEQAVGIWSPGRFAWELTNSVNFANPISYPGAQGLRKIKSDFDKVIQDSLSEAYVTNV